MEILKIMGLFGLNLPYLVAGFSGGAVMLVFVQTDRGRAVAATIGGALVANYMASVVQVYLKFPDATALGCAFMCGLLAPKIVKGLYKRGEKWEENPEKRAYLDDDQDPNPQPPKG